MKTRSVWTIARKDLMEVQQNSMAWKPAIIVPFVFFVLIPVVILILPGIPIFQKQAFSSNLSIEQIRSVLPPEILSLIAGKTDAQIFPFVFLGYLFAPMFLIMPLMLSSIVAAESFAGERERKTLEGLLYSPASDNELFLGKVLAAFIPAILVSWISFIVFTIIINTLGYPLMGEVWFPLNSWWPLIFWITPAIAVLGISVTVLVSSKVNTFMEAYQSGAGLVVLVLGLVVGQATGIIYLNVPIGMLVGLVFWLIDAVLIWFCLKAFKRSQLIGKL
jgi:ABC-2 type transport system permease protein